MVSAAVKKNVEILQAKGEENGLTAALKRLNKEVQVEATLAGILGTALTVKCTFCLGLGHHSGQCQSKKNIDEAVKNLPGLRGIWGTIKGSCKSTGKRTAAMANLNTRLPQLEIEVKKAVGLADGSASAQMDLDGQ